jgi:hypothetical protein
MNTKEIENHNNEVFSLKEREEILKKIFLKKEID